MSGMSPADVNALLRDILARAGRLIASLEEQHPGMPEAREIQRLAAAATAGSLPTPGVAPAGFAPAADGPVAGSLLVVEDEPRIREFIRVVLIGAGHEVLAVAGPHEALTVLGRRPRIHLLLTDVIMPDITGYELAIQARALLPGLRVVFTSGFARDPARHPPADGFLPKPFTADLLNETVQRALR